jgi:hypothetical protein
VNANLKDFMASSSRFGVLTWLGLGILIGVVLMTAVATRWADHLPGTIGVKALDSPDLTAGELATFCRRTSELIPSVYCGGFIGGAIGSRVAISLCLPDDWNTGKARKQFLVWSDKHPDRRGYPAASEVILAHLAYNCRMDGHDN